MEFIDIYDDLGQKCDKSEDKDEAHRKALIHRGVCVWIMNSERELLLQTRSSHVMFPDMLDIPINEYPFCDNEVKEVRYIPLDEFKMMVESGSPLLMPYETHYHFLLITLGSRLIQERNSTNIPFEVKRPTPNVETRAAMDEYDEMKKNPDKYKRYESFDELLDEVLYDA